MKHFTKSLRVVAAFIGGAALMVAVAVSAAALFPSQGGTGVSSGPTKGDLLIGSSTVTYAKLGIGANGKCLTASSTATYGASWETCTSSGITSLNGISTSSILIQGTSNQVNVASSTNLITLSLPQSIGTASFVQFQKLGLGGADNGKFLRVAGSVGLHAVDVVTTNLGSGISGGATAATEPIGVYIAPTFLYPNGPTPTDIVSGLYVDSATLSGSGTSTVTSTASVYVAGPITGTSSQAYSLWVASGTSRLDGPILFGSTLNASGTISQSGTPVVVNTRAVNTGTGLTGGGNLSADRTVSLNINSGSTQSCSASQFVNSLTSTGTIACALPSSSSGTQLPAIIVNSSVANTTTTFTSLATAVSSAANTTTFPDGANIYLTDRAYTVTGTLKLANGVSLIGNPRYTTISFNATSSGSATSPGSTLFNATGTGPANIGLHNLILVNTSGTFSGTALDWSNIALGKFTDVETDGWRYSRYANDTQNNTFYNYFENWQSFDKNDIYASSTNAVNQNTFVNDRCAQNSDGAASAGSPVYCVYMNQAQANKWYSPDWEPGTQVGTIGFRLLSANLGNLSWGNEVNGAYIENNATSVQIEANAVGTVFNGGFECCHLTTGVSDNGSSTSFTNFSEDFNNSQRTYFPSHVGIGTGTGGKPTVGTCGTSPSVVGNDNVGDITTGSTSITACTLTFNTAWITAPICTAIANVTNTLAIVSLSTTAVTFNISSAITSKHIYYTCFGRPN